MDEKTLQLLVDLHINHDRQGPGSEEVFKRALQTCNINTDDHITVADIGSGTGSATIALAQALPNSKIIAVDFLGTFLEKLKNRAKQTGVTGQITTLEADMGALPFNDEEFDLIWSEGAIYNIGFKVGIKAWKPFLKKDGIMVLTEITWLTDNVPDELYNHWQNEYSEVATAEEKITQLKEAGYEVIDHFILPTECWTTHYYNPIQTDFDDFLIRNNNSPEAQEIVEMEKQEINLYKKYKDYVSYGCYIVKKK